MDKTDILITETIRRAQETADGLFRSYPDQIATELKDTHLTDEQCIRNLIEVVAKYNKGLRNDWYNVRDINQVRLNLFIDIDSRTWPVMGSKGIRNARPHKMYNRVFHAILWPLFLSAKRIDYLERLLKGYEKEEETPDDVKDRVKKILRDLFPKAENFEIVAIWRNLNGIFQPINLTYTGVKDRLWEKLWDLKDCINDRRQVATIISEHVNWKKTDTSVAKKLDYTDVYNHIERKRL